MTSVNARRKTRSSGPSRRVGGRVDGPARSRRRSLARGTSTSSSSNADVTARLDARARDARTEEEDAIDAIDVAIDVDAPAALRMTTVE
jgi:hypothetical protein